MAFNFSDASEEQMILMVLITAIVCFALLCITVFMLIKELTIRQKLKAEKSEQTTHNTTTKFYKTWMNRMGLLALIMLVFTPFAWMIRRIPYLCKYLVHVFVFLNNLSFQSVQTYQLLRLQYTLSSNQVHSSFGYSQWVFVFLYIWCGILVCNTVLALIFVWDYDEIKVLFVTKIFVY